MKRLKRIPSITLARKVARSPGQCSHCRYPIAVYQAQYEPTIGGVGLWVACSTRCAERRADETGIGRVGAVY